jgi:hypothetical protein
MSYYAKVVDGIVINVIVAEPDFFETFIDTTPGEWIQACCDTVGGTHRLDGSPLRKNYPSIGYIYDKKLDAFIPPCIYPSWQLNEQTGLYESPIPMPDDGKKYQWDEESQSWQLIKV